VPKRNARRELPDLATSHSRSSNGLEIKGAALVSFTLKFNCALCRFMTLPGIVPNFVPA
jgi:hypothetical protein